MRRLNEIELRARIYTFLYRKLAEFPELVDEQGAALEPRGH